MTKSTLFQNCSKESRTLLEYRSTFRCSGTNVGLTTHLTSSEILTRPDPRFVDVVGSLVGPFCEDHGTWTQCVTSTHRRVVRLVTVEGPRSFTLIGTRRQVERVHAPCTHSDVLVMVTSTVPF